MVTPNDEYFSIMEDLFEHPGWRLLTDEARQQIHNLQANALDVYRSWDEVVEARGRAYQLHEMIMLPEILAAQKDAASEADDDASV